MASLGSSRHVRAMPTDEGKVVINRTTKSGRKLQYEMAVMQQPERARACGSGAKSSADRRPVDPPPVVELKVFEINSEGCQVDITFAYNANFFLFATLESRPMARGRVAAPATPQNPVLTGMPVSGMAYLDRPREAGYFIFPDLSVRHEGQYRLSFNLYEQTNKPEEDGDVEPALDVNPTVATDSKAQEPESSFDWRMEIKSKVFDVYSAKKFPGLAESTHLSRVVAEQGCRVRIRRDVRMRRRVDGKVTDEFESAGGDQYVRGRTESIASDQQMRERSYSISSSGSGGEGQGRRNSGEFYQVPLGGNLGFRLPQESQPFAQPQIMPLHPHYQNPGYQQQQQYAQTHAPQHQGHYAPQSHHQSGHPQSAHPSFPAQRDHMYDDPQRRQSMAGHPNEHFSRYPAQDPSYARNPAPLQRYSVHSPPQLNVLPPINSKMESENSPTGPLPPARQLASIAPAVHSPTWERKDERRSNQYYDFSDSLIPSAVLTPETPRNGNKRAYDATFSTDTSSHSLCNGQRPPSLDDDDGDDSDDETQPIMSYKRATGAVTSRALPVVN